MNPARKYLPPLFGALAIVLAVPAVTAAVTLKPETIAAWDRYVAATEARIERELTSDNGFLAQDFSAQPEEARMQVLGGGIVVSEITTTDSTGKGIPIPNGTIHHWRGCILLPGVKLEQYMNQVQNPSEEGPHQPEVLEMRILERKPDELKFYIKITRTKFINLTYNTEHHVTYHWHGPGRASHWSASTKIAELANAGTPEEQEKPQGQDRGFMWRLNSYWRCEEVYGGLIVEGESMLLSRQIPFGLRWLIEPLIDRAAHEMIINTLEEVKQNHTTDAIVRTH